MEGEGGGEDGGEVSRPHGFRRVLKKKKKRKKSRPPPVPQTIGREAVRHCLGSSRPESFSTAPKKAALTLKYAGGRRGGGPMGRWIGKI